MLPVNPEQILEKLLALGAEIRSQILNSRGNADLAHVDRDSAADTIYRLDSLVEPLLEDFCRDWSRTVPLVLIAEGIDGESGEEGVKVFPEGSDARDAVIRVLIDPIDGTRGLMYDKRSAWFLAGVAPNKGPLTRLRDIEVAVMSELPTSKMTFADVLWAIKGQGSHGQRIDLRTAEQRTLLMQPSKASSIDHGFASISNFFPGTKVLASELMEFIAASLIGPADVKRATVFDDQYISTGGQFYELIMGHDRFNADLRPLFYEIQKQSEGLCCHPYDCAAMLVAEEAGVWLTDGLGNPLDGPLNVTSGISWAGYANAELRKKIEPLLNRFMLERGIARPVA
jgi:fructose-1,6-bisphosphatase/inositol monophosphatase family enzyme